MSVSEIIAAANAARESAAWRACARRADALDAIANALRAREGEIAATASDESGLTREELAPEFARATRTLSRFAAELRSGNVFEEVYEPACADATESIGPNHDLRLIRVALPGVVVVFGASNFPLAYGVLGGDTASALAAGCGVVAKEHPAHPRTGRLLYSIACGALASVDIDSRVLGIIGDDGSDSARVARDAIQAEHVVGVGFTGSRRVGESIVGLGAARVPPVPVFAEMGSLNPILVLGRAWQTRGAVIVEQVATSLLQRHGQQCTAPGLLLLPDDRAAREAFELLREKIEAAPARRMLSAVVAGNYVRRVEEVGALPIVVARSECSRVDGLSGRSDGGSRVARACVMVADGDELPHHSLAWEEIFGPAMLVSWFDDATRSLDSLAGSLTATLHAEPDDVGVGRVLDRLAAVAGRVILNGVPTGVRVSHAMVHSGPWPATNRPEATAVGPRAMLRWMRPVTLQNCPAWATSEGLSS